MNLELQAQAVGTIRDTLEGKIGETLKVRANMGRSKIVEDEGTLMQAHPQLFIMEVKRKRGRTMRQSYQYADILTGTVELYQDGELVFEPFNFDEEEEIVVKPLDSLGFDFNDSDVLLS